MNNYINFFEIIISVSNYRNVAYRATPGQILEDNEGMQIMRILGKNTAWLIKVLEVGKTQFEAPEAERKTFMNFIR